MVRAPGGITTAPGNDPRTRSEDETMKDATFPLWPCGCAANPEQMHQRGCRAAVRAMTRHLHSCPSVTDPPTGNRNPLLKAWHRLNVLLRRRGCTHCSEQIPKCDTRPRPTPIIADLPPEPDGGPPVASAGPLLGQQRLPRPRDGQPAQAVRRGWPGTAMTTARTGRSYSTSCQGDFGGETSSVPVNQRAHRTLAPPAKLEEIL